MRRANLRVAFIIGIFCAINAKARGRQRLAAAVNDMNQEVAASAQSYVGGKVFVLPDSDANAVGESGEDVLRIATPEDVVLQKLRWFRSGDEVSNQLWRDVLGVLKRRSSSLDVGYMRKWALILGVGELLDRALAETKVE